MPIIHITNVTELQAMANDPTASYELDNNIDASATSGWNGGLGFDPVGRLSPYFTGLLEGNNYTINGLYINRQGVNNVGMFGMLTTGSTAQNIKMVEAIITGAGSGSDYWGILAGACGRGTVTNCHTAGSVSGRGNLGGLVGWVSGLTTNGATITNCSSSALVTGTGIIVGGLVGDCGYYGNVDILKCFATGAVSSSSSYVGGLIGNTRNTLATNCYARGSVTGSSYVGGFIGLSTYQLDNCYSTGLVAGGASTGGFCGSNSGTITDSFWDTETSGQATSSGGTGKTTAEMKTKTTFTDAGWNFTTIWIMGGYPYLQAYPPPTLTTGIPQII